MMQRFALIIGLIVLLAPQATYAEVDCNALLDNPQPVSPYVQRTLERIQKAKDSIQNSSSGNGATATLFVDAVRWAGAEITSIVDSYVQVTAETASLENRTACEQYDALLLQCSMEDVLKELNAAISSGNFSASFQYQNLHTFINQRLRAMLVGARDPRLQDATWGEEQSFEDIGDVWCCIADTDESDGGGVCQKASASECQQQGVAYTTLASCTAFGCTAPDEPPQDTGMLCAFSSDYLPADGKGFGCDLSILEKLQGYDTVRTERTAFEKLMDHIADFRKNMTSLAALEQQIEALMDGGRTPPPAQEEPEEEEQEHYVLNGCSPGRCAADREKSCTKNNDCAANDYCLRGWLRCEESPNQDCADDNDCEAGACVLVELPDLTWELRGTFSAERDEVGLLEAFNDRRQREPREFSDELKLPGEESPGEPTPRLGSLAERMLRTVARSGVREFSRTQSRLEAERFARGSDPIYQMAEAFQPVRSAGRPLAELAHKPDGLRQLVSRFAWFLRRTCVDRVCNSRLEWIMRIAKTESCFPYTDGTYLQQSCANPQWKKCVDDAELNDVLKLPGLNCDE